MPTTRSPRTGGNKIRWQRDFLSEKPMEWALLQEREHQTAVLTLVYRVLDEAV
jgi:hypothetical protein